MIGFFKPQKSVEFMRKRHDFLAKVLTYTAEFKQSAVKLANESDVPVAETARNLGINENTLYTWISK